MNIILIVIKPVPLEMDCNCMHYPKFPCIHLTMGSSGKLSLDVAVDIQFSAFSSAFWSRPMLIVHRL